MLSILAGAHSFLQLGKKRPAWQCGWKFAMKEEGGKGEEGRKQAWQEAVWMTQYMAHF